jgi:hypothetical protein
MTLSTQPPQKKSPGLFGWIGIVVGIGFGIIALIGAVTGPTHSAPPPRDTTAAVIYRVTGVAANFADVTYQNAQGGTEQRHVSLPWNMTLTVNHGAFAYLSAQNASAYGAITCEIQVDGVPFKKSTSSGAYTIASCSGSAP